MNGRADVPYETLDLPEPARSLFRKTRVALEMHVSAYAANGEGYKLGGGTILAARWKHRRSNDIDVLFHPDTKTSHYSGIEDLERGFEIVGINHFLRAQGENAEQIRDRTAGAMADRQTTIVFEIEPRRPRNRAVELEPIPR